jgi:peptidyl-tRNA hydrolase, PTH1 family
MKIIAGLGNPGVEYRETRHNVGFMVVETLLDKLQLPNLKFQTNSKFQAEMAKTQEMVLVKPMAYMNRSGEVIRRVIDYFADQLEIRDSKINNLYVVHDDLDIRLGDYKVQLGKGPKVHNGVASVERAMGTQDFWRVRVGVDNRSQDLASRVQGRGYVLGRFTMEELEVVERVIGEIVVELQDKVTR